MAVQNADELGYAGGVAIGVREIVATLPLLLGVEVSLIVQELVFQCRCSFDRGQRCSELIRNTEGEGELTVDRVLAGASRGGLLEQNTNGAE